MRILVLGGERSGTTWTAQALAAATGAQYVHEPDSPGVNPGARHEPVLGRYPVLDPGATAPSGGTTASAGATDLAGYDELWDLAFSGSWPLKPAPAAVVDAFSRLPRQLGEPLTRGARATLRAARHLKLRSNGRAARPDGRAGTADGHGRAGTADGHGRAGTADGHGTPGRPVVAKSVYAMFCVEWLVDRYRPSVVIVRREPVAVAASLVHLGAPDRFEKLRRVYLHPRNQERYVAPLGLPELPPHLEVPEACAWWAAFVTTVLSAEASRHPDWILVEHAELTAGGAQALSGLAERVVLPGGGHLDRAALERFVDRSSRPGRGYSTRRTRHQLTGEPPAGGRADSAGDGRLRGRLAAVVDAFPR